MSEEEKKPAEVRTIDFHFIKTSGYRTYYVDGAFGGITPKGKVYVELFLERPATPQRITYEVSDEKGMEEIAREGKEGAVREIGCGLMMDIRAAVALRDWLDIRIDEYSALVEKIESHNVNN
ncbi:MAG: hypothetical protein ABIR47_14610 [Candidatus Kapaibacterium sp.]